MSLDPSPQGSIHLRVSSIALSLVSSRKTSGTITDQSATPLNFREHPAMPRGTQLKDFGKEFEEILRRADKAMQSGREEFSVDFAQQKIADALRFRIYKYFKALRSCSDRPDLTAMCTDLSMRVVGCTLHFYRRGDDKDAAALRDALGM